LRSAEKAALQLVRFLKMMIYIFRSNKELKEKPITEFYNNSCKAAFSHSLLLLHPYWRRPR